jgi:hypothetical protein
MTQDNNSNLPTVSGTKLAAKGCDWFYDPIVKELCKSVQGKELTKDEALLLALAAGQAALANYVHPGERDADETINEILGVLDHDRIGEALHAKAAELLAERQASIGKDEAGSIEPPPLLLGEVLSALYDSEINAAVNLSSFWDGGWSWTMKLGDELNGLEAERDFDQEEFRSEAVNWLIDTACKAYPQSTFAQKYAARLKCAEQMVLEAQKTSSAT